MTKATKEVDSMPDLSDLEASDTGVVVNRETVKDFKVSTGVIAHAHQTVIYGGGGIGKTSLACNYQSLGKKVLLLDLESGSHHINVPRIGDATNRIKTWEELIYVLGEPRYWKGVDVVIVDSLTIAEQLCAKWVLQNIKHEKGHAVNRMESYGFGKGFTHLYETMLLLLDVLDWHQAEGRSVICIAHDGTFTVPNPIGEDFLKFGPRLYTPSKGSKSSVRNKVAEWCDHLLYIEYDKSVNKEGKVTGGTSRKIYCKELPHFLAKSRTLQSKTYSFASADDASIWKAIEGSNT